MREADILALTYTDTFSVYRPFKDTLPSGESIFKSGIEGKIVYANVPCALSNQTTKQSKGIVTVSEGDFQLFYRPEIEIQANDTLVINHLGYKYTVITNGKVKRYVSHNILPIYEKEIA